MKDLRQYFSSESIEKLESLNEDSQNADAFSDSEIRELFRTLHTIKGNAQTFGFASASRLAHRLESLLSSRSEEIFTNVNAKSLFLEGVGLLIKCLQEKHFAIPASFTGKIDAIVPASTGKNNFSETISPEIPNEIFSQLSSREKDALVAASSDGKTIYGLEVGFDSADFAARFKKLRKTLSESCEIIATLPSPKLNAAGKIGFRFLFACSLQTEQIRQIAETNAARVILDTSEAVFSNDLPGVLSQVAEYGKTLAEKFGKRIEFAVTADEMKLSAQKLKLIFDVLVHLTRNAVDHGIEVAGRVEITLKIKENDLYLTISDDGRGIDSEKIKAEAVEKDLVSANANLSEQETIDLIFAPEFSTASELTEVSGRGIGLDAVKTAVEAASGKIKVKSQNGKGTRFEIFLPR